MGKHSDRMNVRQTDPCRVSGLLIFSRDIKNAMLASRTFGHSPRVLPRIAGATLMETVMATLVVGILFIALYSGVTAGIRMLQMSRENLRATQILIEKMEGIRLFNWDQINSNGFIPTQFTQAYYSTPDTNASPSSPNNRGIVYNGRVLITNVPFSTTYAPEMKMIEVELSWTSAMNRPCKRTIRSFVSQHGLQNYIY